MTWKIKKEKFIKKVVDKLSGFGYNKSCATEKNSVT